MIVRIREEGEDGGQRGGVSEGVMCGERGYKELDQGGESQRGRERERVFI